MKTPSRRARFRALSRGLSSQVRRTRRPFQALCQNPTDTDSGKIGEGSSKAARAGHGAAAEMSSGAMSAGSAAMIQALALRLVHNIPAFFLIIRKKQVPTAARLCSGGPTDQANGVSGDADGGQNQRGPASVI